MLRRVVSWACRIRECSGWLTWMSGLKREESELVGGRLRELMLWISAFGNEKELIIFRWPRMCWALKMNWWVTDKQVILLVKDLDCRWIMWVEKNGFWAQEDPQKECGYSKWTHFAQWRGVIGYRNNAEFVGPWSRKPIFPCSILQSQERELHLWTAECLRAAGDSRRKRK